MSRLISEWARALWVWVFRRQIPELTAGSMKIRSTLFIVGVTFLSCAVSRANILNMTYEDDGDGAVVCPNGWDGNTGALHIYGAEMQPGAAHILGTITTDTTVDPTLTLASSIDNDTGLGWTAYRVNVVMSTPFTIVTGSPSVSSPLGDWYVADTIAPTLQASGVYAGQYEGTIDFSQGTTLAPGATLDFSYAIHFAGSTDYSFTQEMIPTTVPEPASLSLLVGALLAGKRLAGRRS